MKSIQYLLTGLALVFITPALLVLASTAAAQSSNPADTVRAVAVLHPTQNSTVKGVVSFTGVLDDVQVQADIEGLSAGKRGFHIHTYGDCSAPDATSAGGHYNPYGFPHAGPQQKKRHMAIWETSKPMHPAGPTTRDWTATLS